MKVLSLTLLMGLFIHSVSAQNPDLKVIATAGKSYASGNIQLDWTLGESVTLILENPPVLLSQGFHQPDYNFISSSRDLKGNGSVEAYPNPCEETLNIHLIYNSPVHGVLEIVDMSGKKMERQSFSGNSLDKQFNVANLPPGRYLINILESSHISIPPISFIKL